MNSTQTSPIDVRALAQAGVEALRGGDAHRARELFELIAAENQADGSVYLGLAYACSALKDRPAALAAVDHALALEPRNLRALVMKADHLADIGDPRAASNFYRVAVNVAPPIDQMPADLRDELRRAQAMCERYAAEFDAFLRERLFKQGLVERGPTKRFRDSLDILTGRKRIFVQEPRQFFFAELPQIQYYDRKDFPWLDNVEAATADIRSELIEVMKEDSAFKPYVEGSPRQPQTGNREMLNNPYWSAFYLWKNGKLVTENAVRCPKTFRALADAPHAQISSVRLTFEQIQLVGRI